MIPEEVYRVCKEFINTIPNKEWKEIVYDVNTAYAIDCWLEEETKTAYAVLYSTADINNWKLLKREKLNG